MRAAEYEDAARRDRGNPQTIDFAAPVVAIIVGLHFISLARWLPARLYYACGALLVALGTTVFRIRNVDQRILYVTIGAACVYWLTCFVAVRFGNDTRQAAGKSDHRW